jgi:hypothetical protein
MGISANSSSLRDASAITPTLDSAESVDGGAEGQRKVSTVSQGETRRVSERQHASDVAVAVEAARFTRASGMPCVKILMR